MRLLLDSHTLYWYIEGDPKLSTVAQSLIQDASNTVHISPSSYWEIAIKISMGKWNINRPYEDFMNLGINQYGFEILPILPSHTAQLIGLPFYHKGPFDRLLVAQALVEQIPLVSADKQLESYGVTRLW